jgi:glucose/arabinose dehydrogenase
MIVTRMVRSAVTAAILAAVGVALPALSADRTFYRVTEQTCDGWPRASIGMAPGYCAGLVVAPPQAFEKRILKFPRLLLQLSPTDWLVTDLGHWASHDGSVFRLTAVRGQPAILKPLLSKLYIPHGLARGPDGRIYVGEMSRIFRFDPDAADPSATTQTVVTGLPDNRLHEDRHPLTFFIFDDNGDLLVDVGAPSDQCDKNGKPDGTDFCSESEGADKTAGIRRYAYLGDAKWSAEFTMLARGLRNSLALARHRSGTLLQAENSMDFPNGDSPFEKLNVLKNGAHYGWPYCYDMASAAPVWAQTGKFDCTSDTYTKPVRLLPPHAAPLSMLYYDGAMFPQLRGDLLMTWHGYQPSGSRIAAFAVDYRGVPLLTRRAHYVNYAEPAAPLVDKPYPGPASEPLLLTPGWDNVDGEHPRGAPVGLAVADDGAIWVTEDKNATILRIARDQP